MIISESSKRRKHLGKEPNVIYTKSQMKNSRGWLKAYVAHLNPKRMKNPPKGNTFRAKQNRLSNVPSVKYVRPNMSRKKNSHRRALSMPLL
mmetsp:Transcript_19298/g.18994  ORF Transcript_19298/g.18994 Transcript_19298/m.18994 type:complete len:91 (-) Transcript_19298:223-495(-)